MKYVNEEAGSLMIWMLVFRYYNDNQRPKYNILFSGFNINNFIFLLKLTGVGIITDCVRIELAELSD